MILFIWKAKSLLSIRRMENKTLITTTEKNFLMKVKTIMILQREETPQTNFNSMKMY